MCRRAVRGSALRLKAGWVAYVTQDGSCKTGDDAGSERDPERRRPAKPRPRFRCHLIVDEFGTSLVDGKLTWTSRSAKLTESRRTDGIRDLLADDGDEAGVKGAETFGRGDLRETGDQAGRILHVSVAVSRYRPADFGIRDETDTGRFERCQEDVGEESVLSVSPSWTYSAIVAPPR